MDELRPELTSIPADTGKPALLGRLSCIGLAVVLFLSGCDAARNESASTADTTAAVSRVDSILPIEEAVRRFRDGLPEVTGVDGGESSRSSLVHSFVRAVEANDTSAIQRMLLSRAEYAYLYFPSSIYMNKPYQQAPALAWFLNVQNSEKGITRVMRRLGGKDIAFESYSCNEESREGDNTFWRACTLVYRDPVEKSQVTRRLFGTIMERDGRYKFLSYSNDL